MSGRDEDDKNLIANIGVQGALIVSSTVSILGFAADFPLHGGYSPYGMASLVAMLKVGAGPGTKERMKIQLLDISDEMMYNGFQMISQSLTKKSNKKNFALRMEKRLFVKNTLKINEKFSKTLGENFSTLLVPVDFSNAEKTINKINQWSSRVTKNKVVQFFPDNTSFPRGLKLLMLDVAYFKGIWAQEFDTSKTKDDVFFSSSGEIIKTPFMNALGRFMTGIYQHFDAGNGDAKMEVDIISIPFKGNRLRMIVYMTNEETELKSIILKARDSTIFLPQLLHSITLTEKNVNLSIPKFSCETRSVPFISLLLGQFAIPEPMNWSEIGRDADGNVLNSEGIDARQIIFVEFDEQGGKQKLGVKKDEEVFEIKINRPFVYTICDMYTDVALAQGTCNNPLDTSYKYF